MPNNIDPKITYTKLDCFLQNGQDANVYLLEGPEVNDPSTLPKKDRDNHWFGPNSKYIAWPSGRLYIIDINHNWAERN